MAVAIIGLRSLLNGDGPASLAALIGVGIATYAVAACLLNIAGVGKYVQALFGKRLAADSGAI
jgi:hypothetical protein